MQDSRLSSTCSLMTLGLTSLSPLPSIATLSPDTFHPFTPSTNALVSSAEEKSSHRCRRAIEMLEKEEAMVLAIRSRRFEVA